MKKYIISSTFILSIGWILSADADGIIQVKNTSANPVGVTPQDRSQKIVNSNKKQFVFTSALGKRLRGVGVASMMLILLQ